jgi:anti-sigma regulatory factor (Ser/Thr protein kinase)
MPRLVWEYASGREIEAGRLRRRIMSVVRRHGGPLSDFSGAELICGELIANAVRHAPGHVTVCLDWSRDAPTVTIADDGPAFSIVRPLPGDVLAETGRGLFIVRSLARKIEFDLLPSDGAKITVELPVHKRAGKRNPARGRLTPKRGL